MGHASGMIGFPLRLLARENYERVVKAKGADRVALVTGEEKIVPPRAKYFLCTVESMPLDRMTDFLAVDEIQMCADGERGHIFTDRLLHARGGQETLFLGSDTIRPLISRLIPGIEFVTRPRLSELTYAGPRKLARLPPKSAIVAFSAAEVYAMAEFVRRGRGGAAVVLGALSPRTRNAQVSMYQAGEVEYIVATDAIGMGLNMDVDHVAFASLRKFDGQGPRGLTAPEVAQIAGRAGRHMTDGTFGTTADQPGIPDEIVAAVEEHRFPALKALYWRNPELRFTSIPALIASLDRPPEQAGLLRARDADDYQALTIMARNPEVLAKTDHPERVRLLWDVCQIPDFRKVMAEAHTRLLDGIFAHLTAPGERLPADWLAAQVSRQDRVDGDIDTLMGRIAATRTWTYVSHRGDWVGDPLHWQGVTRAIEDRLSDALHERLTQRFVDRRTAVLVKKMRDQASLSGRVDLGGKVQVEGHAVGQLAGFRFRSDRAEGANAARAVLSAAERALKPEIAQRVQALDQDGDEAFMLTAGGDILWRDDPIARLLPGPDALSPSVEALTSDLLDPVQREKIRKRAHRWVRGFIGRAFGPLADPDAAVPPGAMRGLLHALAQGLGGVPRKHIAAQVSALTGKERDRLTQWGIRIGFRDVFVAWMLKPPMLALRAVLHETMRGKQMPATDGRACLPAPSDTDETDASALGYSAVAGVWVRTDALDRLAGKVAALAKANPEGFAVPEGLARSLKTSAVEAEKIVAALGYRRDETGFVAAPRKSKRPKIEAASDSPFAVLKSSRPAPKRQ